MIPTKAVVINLRRRPDRLESFLARWEWLGLDLPLEVFEAIDGDARSVPDYWAENGGAYGCYLSHLSVLRHAEGPILVLEDDAVFSADMRTVMDQEPTDDWDIFYLGGRLDAFAVTQTRAGIFPIKAAAKTHAYIARNPSVLVSVLEERLREGQHIDWILRDERLKKVAAQPFVAGQDAGRSDINEYPRRAPAFWNSRFQERIRHARQPA